mgnify:CR=1 FL=1
MMKENVHEEKIRKSDVEFFFGMEHGVRGDLYAGDGKLSDVDVKTEEEPVVNKSIIDGLLNEKVKFNYKIELDKNGFNRLPSWQDALCRYLKEIEEIQ